MKSVISAFVVSILWITGCSAATLIAPTEPEAVYPVQIVAEGVNVGEGNTICLGVNANPWNDASRRCNTGTTGTGNDNVHCSISLGVGETITSVTAWRYIDCTDVYAQQSLASDVSIEIVATTTTEEGTSTSTTDIVEKLEEVKKTINIVVFEIGLVCFGLFGLIAKALWRKQ